jgi:hypothetical protein
MVHNIEKLANTPPMDASPLANRESLMQAIEAADQRRRDLRADRIEWLALHEVNPPMVIGRTETMHVLREAREVFVDGHFVAALMMAMSFIEHTIVEELQILGHVSGSPSFAQAIETAKEKKTFPLDWLERAKTLSLRRNPFAHLKEGNHPHTLGMRVRNEKRHPRVIVETDAKDAIELMYKFFVATLREEA